MTIYSKELKEITDFTHDFFVCEKNPLNFNKSDYCMIFNRQDIVRTVSFNFFK